MENSSRETTHSLSRSQKGLVAKSKLWIENENGEVVFGEGRLRIVEAIERHGSMNAAAQELQMSYQAVWGKIKATERRMGQPLLLRKTGGTKGGGSELTPFARQIVERFRKLKGQTEAAMDTVFEDLFASRSINQAKNRPVER
jgi:molybdate transport system regulatory protein